MIRLWNAGSAMITDSSCSTPRIWSTVRKKWGIGVSGREGVTVAEKFYGYCFMEDGFHTPSVTLDGAEGVYHYLKLQSCLFPRVIATDSGDCCIAEIIDGKFTFPPEWKKFNREVTPDA
jgi:hypothetical protein